MTIICNVCGYDKNPDEAEFCDACGAELRQPESASTTTTPPISTTTTPPISTTTTPPISTTTTPPISTTTPAANAKLIAKQTNAPTPEFEIKGTAVIGIFDPDMGPVDIDLEQFQGSETVSGNHAEIYQEGGVWKIKDLGSTNGVFIKPAGQTRFNSRITTPVLLNSGDEIAFAKVIFLFQSP